MNSDDLAPLIEDYFESGAAKEDMMKNYQIDYRIGTVTYSMSIRAKTADAAGKKLQGFYIPAIAAKILVITIEEAK